MSDTTITPPAAVALYVPATRPERFGKAAAAGADVVIIDLEDSVPPAHKASARATAIDYLSVQPVSTPTVVRINSYGTPWYEADISAVGSVIDNLAGIRLPKAEHPDDVRRITDALGAVPVDVIVESARGVENLFAIASAANVASIALGEADLRSELSISASDGLDWIRGRLVVAARAAGLPAPMMSVWTSVRDLSGLAASCRDGRSRGFYGRAAIHPAQIPVIRAAFQPSDDEVAHARQVLDALRNGAAAGSGAVLLPDGDMVDEAMRRAAERTLAFGKSAGTEAAAR